VEKVAKAKAKTKVQKRIGKGTQSWWPPTAWVFGPRKKKEINLLYLFIFVFSDFLSLLNTLFMCLALLCRENVTGSQFPSVFL